MTDADLEAMRTMVTAAMQTMGRALEDFNKKAKDSVSSSSGGFGQLSSMLKGMVADLSGPVGIAAGIYAVSKSLETFAVGRVQLQMFSQDVGLSTKTISNLKSAMADMGISAGQAEGYIAKMGAVLKDALIWKEGSKVVRDLVEMGEGKFAANFLKVIESGDFDTAEKMFETKVARMSAAAKAHFAVEVIGIPESVLTNLDKFRQKAAESFEGSYEHSEKYIRSLNRLETQLGNVLARIAEFGIVGLMGGQEVREQGLYNREGQGGDPEKKSLYNRLRTGNWGGNWGSKFQMPEWITTPWYSQLLGGAAASFPPVGGDAPATFDERFRATDFSGRSKLQQLVAQGLAKYQSGVDWLNDRSPAIDEKDKSILLKLHDMVKPPDVESVLDQMIPINPLLFLKHAAQQYAGKDDATFADRFSALWSGGGTGVSSRDMLEIETDSNKLLRDVRDSLMRMEMGAGGGGSSTGGALGHGIPGIPGGPVSPFKFGAARSGGGAAGITAPAGTPMQGGMATVTAPDGKTFQVDPTFKDNFQGFINDYYAAGGKFGGSTGTLGFRPGNASGHPIGTAIDVNQVGRGVRARTGVTLPPEMEDALAAKWGMVSGNQWSNNDQGHFGIRNAQAAREALIKNGVMPSEAEAAVKGSWFQDRITASGADASRAAGIALPSRAGLGKMFEVTTPDGRKFRLPQIDVGPAAWTGRGIDISRGAANQMGYGGGDFPTDQVFKYREIDDARAAIDQSQLSQRIDASMNAVVDFRNMPSWVKSTVDTNNAFKTLKITRSTPQAGKAGSGIPSSNPWSYE